MKKVTNEEFNLALKNEDYLKIAKSIIKRFKFDRDTKKDCLYIGLWQALAKFKPERNIKFTTYLYYRVLWYCIKTAKLNKSNLILKDLSNSQDISASSCCEYELFEQIPVQYRDLIYDKVIGNLSLHELSEKYKVSHESIRKKIKKGLEWIKSEISGV